MIFLPLILFWISLLLFMKFKTKWKISFYIYLFFILLFITFTNIYYGFSYFTWKWLDNSVLYYFRYWTEWTWWLEYKKLILVSILLVLFSLLFLIYYLRLYSKKWINDWINNIFYNKISFILLFFSFFFHPLMNNILELNWFYEEGDYLKSYGLVFEDYYKKPIFKDIDKKKNIIFIYLESYEKLYLDEDLFPGLSNWLNNLKNNSIYFDNLYQAYWTSWTIAWMVGSQCWIPLILPSKINTSDLNTSYLSWAYCIWDYLKKAWYNLNYIWWSSMKFAGKWDFYKSHWFDSLEWKDEIVNNLEDKNYLYSWWLYDDTVFDYTYKKYDELIKKDQPFWLFMLSMDTHWDSGVISNKCNNLKYDNDESSILNSYHCTDYLLSDFLKKIKNHPNFEDTIIFIASDHYAMDNNNSYNILDKNKDNRWMLFLIHNVDEKNNEIINKKWDTLDIWATVLSYLWFPVEQLWLWIDLLNNNKNRDSNIILSLWKKEYEKFWE